MTHAGSRLRTVGTAALVLAAAAFAAYGLSRGAAPVAAAATLLAAWAAFSLLRASRGLAALVAAAAVAGTALAVSAVHEAMRGEGRGALPGPARLGLPALPDLVSEDRLRFAVWSDCRGDVLVFKRVLDSIRRRAPRFHVGLGDLVGMARPYQFEILRDRLVALDVPAFVLPGNHDRDPDGSLRAFRAVFGAPERDLETKHAVLAGIDTSAGLAVEDVERVERLFAEDRLAGAGGGRRHAVLLTHYPLFPPAGRPDKALRDGPLLERLRALVRARRATVFSGNHHAYDALDLGGHFQVVTGGAGSKLESDDPFHYVWVEVDETGVRFERVDVAAPSEASPRLHRWRTFLDEAPYAPRIAPLPTALGFAALAAALGGLAAAAAPRRRRRHRDETETSA